MVFRKKKKKKANPFFKNSTSKRYMILKGTTHPKDSSHTAQVAESNGKQMEKVDLLAVSEDQV